jgi:hypothetical protein
MGNDHPAGGPARESKPASPAAGAARRPARRPLRHVGDKPNWF